MSVAISADACIGCTACIGTCPVEALVMEGDKAIVDAAACIDCGACVPECPTEAITM